jgi:hypothetical protein
VWQSATDIDIREDIMVDLVFPPDIGSSFRAQVRREQRLVRGSHFWTYEPLLVPGLVQTYAYADLILRNFGFQGERLALYLAFRLGRQALMLERADAGTSYLFLLNESVLLRRAGNQMVMAQQMEYLEFLADYPGITIRVIPFTAGAIRGNSPLVITQVTPSQKLLFIEGARGDTNYRSAAVVQQWERIFAGLEAKSLSPRLSMRLMSQRATYWRNAA